MTKISFPVSLALIGLIFVATLGYGLTRVGMNPDDWRGISQVTRYPLLQMGRWGSDIVSNEIFLERLYLGIQIPLAFSLLALVSYKLAAIAASPDKRNIAAVLIFLVGSNHMYLTSVLHYYEFTAAFSFVLAAGILAMTPFCPRQKPRSRSVSVVLGLISVQLIAVGFGIYPSFAVLGLIVPLLVLIRVDRYGLSQAIRFFAIALLLYVLGFLLHTIESKVVEWIINPEPTISRFQMMTLDSILEKLSWLPTVERNMHSGRLVNPTVELRAFFLFVSIFAFLQIAVAASVVIAKAECSPLNRGIKAARIILAGIAALAFVPLSFWFLYQDLYLPGRALGFFGFVIAAVIVANTELLASQFSRPSLARVTVLSAYAMLFIYGVLQSYGSHRHYDLMAEGNARDLRILEQIVGQLEKLEDPIPRRHVNMVGGVHYDDLRWGGLGTSSSLHPLNHWAAILNSEMDLDTFAATIPFSPRACPAIPSPGSTFIHDGDAYVCLTESAAPEETVRCTDVIEGFGNRICMGADYLMVQTPSCKPGQEETNMVTLELFSDASNETDIPSAELSIKTTWNATVPQGAGCAGYADIPSGTAVDKIVAFGQDRHRQPLWRKEFKLSEMQPYKPLD